MAGGFLSVAAGVGGRALFGLVLATTVLRHLPGDQTVVFFQLLLLQSVFINFTGGGGYVRGAARSSSPHGAERLLRGYLAAVILALAALTLPGLLAGAGYSGLHLPARPWQIGILLPAGVAASLAAHLQGILSGTAGVRRIFLPLALTYAIMAGGLLLLPPVGLAGALGLLALSQSAPLVLLVLLQKRARRLLVRALRIHPGGNFGAPLETIAVGAAAACYLLIFYAFREVWASRVDAVLAASAFFVFRMSETGFQVVSIVLAGSARLPAAASKLAGRGPVLGFGAMLAVLASGATQWSAILWLSSAIDGLGVLAACVAMQLACETLRAGTAAVSVFELRAGRTLRFPLLTVLPAVVSGVAATVLPVMWGPGGLFLFATLFSVCQICLWLFFQMCRRPAGLRI